jgi:hypothetical protein
MGRNWQEAPVVGPHRGAGRVIAPVFADSPQYEVEPLNDEIGLRLVCKVGDG